MLYGITKQRIAYYLGQCFLTGELWTPGGQEHNYMESGGLPLKICQIYKWYFR